MLIQCAVILVAFGEMFSLNVRLTLITALSLPVTFAVGLRMRKKIFPVSWLIQSRLAESRCWWRKTSLALRVVKSFAAEQKELDNARPRGGQAPVGIHQKRQHPGDLGTHDGEPAPR